MKELVKVATNAKNEQVVSARELHQFLGYDKSQWKRWYETNIQKNQFALENVDYVGFDIVSNGNESKDFSISLDFAKRLSMMARTENGEKARLYFIQCEKKLNSGASYQIEDPIERAKRWIVEQEEKKLLENKVENLSVAFNIESQWLSILKVAMHNKTNEKTFDWRKLKSESQRLGFEVKKMPSRRFEYQNVYHKDVFRISYPEFNYNF